MLTLGTSSILWMVIASILWVLWMPAVDSLWCVNCNACMQAEVSSMSIQCDKGLNLTRCLVSISYCTNYVIKLEKIYCKNNENDVLI